MNTFELQTLDRSLARNGFERFEAIGEGLGTSVFRCHKIESGQNIALKWWNSDFRNPALETALESYLQNLKSRARERMMPHCVQVRAVSPKRRYVIMSLMRENVAVHQGGAAMEPEKATQFLRRSLECLHRLHARRNIHGALKPTNVFVDRHGQFALSDCRYVRVNANGLVEDTDWHHVQETFRAGVARSQACEVRDHSHAKYLAPESINPDFGPRGIWVDQFMLGFMAFELLLGSDKFDRLFPGVGAEAKDVELGWLRWHGSGERTPSPYDTLPELDSGLKNVLHRLTRKEVDKRYSDVRAAIQALMQDTVASSHVMPGIADEEPVSALPGRLTSIVEDVESRSLVEERSAWLSQPEESTNPPGRKIVMPKALPGRGQGVSANPFEDLEPERFTREWWEEKLAEPRTVRRSKLAGAGLVLLSLTALVQSTPDESRLVFASATPGIEVRVNGERVELDRELSFAVGKEIAIEATAGNFEPLTGRMERVVRSAEPKILSIELKPRLCQLRVDPGLPTASVKLNGERYPGDSGEFPVGSKVVIEWSAPGFEQETKTFVIPDQAAKKLRFSSFAKRAKPRQVLVSTSPPGAAVRSGPDGKLLGRAGETFEIEVGTHSLKLELEGYEPLNPGVIEVRANDGTQELGNFTLKPLLRRGTLEVTTDPPDAHVETVALNDSGQEITGLVPGEGGQVPVGSTWKVTASHKGRTQTKQIKVAEGPNRLSFALAYIARIRNKMGMEFVYVPPPMVDFEFGTITAQTDAPGPASEPDHEKPFHGRLRELSRVPWSPPALVMHQEAVKVPRRPAFHVPAVKVRVSMGIYVGVDEVTVGDWRRVMGERPQFMNEVVPEDHPVSGILRKEAQAFLNQMARLEGLPPGTYRLLTDAEFDYLSKHGDATERQSTLAETHRRKPGPVHRSAADIFGLRELNGNVAELVEDYFVRGYHEHFRNRTDPVQHLPSEVGIARGCHFGTASGKFSHDYRMFVNSNDRSRDSHVGFRVVRVPGSVTTESSGIDPGPLAESSETANETTP